MTFVKNARLKKNKKLTWRLSNNYPVKYKTHKSIDCENKEVRSYDSYEEIEKIPILMFFQIKKFKVSFYFAIVVINALKGRPYFIHRYEFFFTTFVKAYRICSAAFLFRCFSSSTFGTGGMFYTRFFI